MKSKVDQHSCAGTKPITLSRALLAYATGVAAKSSQSKALVVSGTVMPLGDFAEQCAAKSLKPFPAPYYEAKEGKALVLVSKGTPVAAFLSEPAFEGRLPDYLYLGEQFTEEKKPFPPLPDWNDHFTGAAQPGCDGCAVADSNALPCRPCPDKGKTAEAYASMREAIFAQFDEVITRPLVELEFGWDFMFELVVADVFNSRE